MSIKIRKILNTSFCAVATLLITSGVIVTFILLAKENTTSHQNADSTKPTIISSNLSNSTNNSSPLSSENSATADIAIPVSFPSTSFEEDILSENTNPKFIDLQFVIDKWIASTNRRVGLMLYDLDNDQVAASYQPDKIFNVASIYKLFFAYDGYRQIDLGLDDPTALFSVTSDYRAGKHTLSECLDLMIRESYNGCADRMYASPSRQARVQTLIESLNLASTEAYGLYSNASDLTIFLSYLWKHPDLSENSWSALADSMLNQPPTKINATDTYDWRQGTPAGFSDSVNVYNKVGWSWNGKSWDTYADAMLLEFPTENRHYSLVVLTENFPSFTPLTSLATFLESAITNTNIE